MAEFVIPAFLEDETLERIHERMLFNLPADMDVSEGSHPWNLTMPTAYEIAQLTEMVLPEAIRAIFPQYSENFGDILDYHAQTRGLARKTAQQATGRITITGEAGTEIPAGSLFSTVSQGDVSSVEFETIQDYIIDETGTVEAKIRAVDAGTSGNVGINTIILNSGAVDGITAVTNAEATAGGLDEETNEALQTRIVEADRNSNVSYGGTTYDYKRWAEEVQGVGTATIIAPANDTGLIQIVITDVNGEPASETVRTRVYNHIMSPDSPLDRLAPINDQIIVVQPTTVNIAISAVITLAAGRTLESLKTSLTEALKSYVGQATEEGVVRISRIGAMLSQQAEVEDYQNLKLNGGTTNVTISAGATPAFNVNGITA